MADLHTMYRVMILYMLNQVEYPLTNTQITNFILEKEYTNYFTVQEILSDLISSQLITAESTHNNTRYRITPYGQETLGFFHVKISDAIKEDIRTYFVEHDFDLKQETSVYADYYKVPGEGYAVRCRIRNRGDRYRGSDLACFWQTAGRSGLSELEKESFPDL